MRPKPNIVPGLWFKVDLQRSGYGVNLLQMDSQDSENDEVGNKVARDGEMKRMRKREMVCKAMLVTRKIVSENEVFVSELRLYINKLVLGS